MTDDAQEADDKERTSPDVRNDPVPLHPDDPQPKADDYDEEEEDKE